MYHGGPLMADDAAAMPLHRHRRASALVLVTAVLLLALGLVLATVAVTAGFWRQDAPIAGKSAKLGPLPRRPLDPERLVVADPAQIEALTQAQALAVNAGRPVSALPNPPALAFVLGTDAPDYHRALACLTAAIYYEAAYEPANGQRAVAQVVLNRVRHPLYPHTVCGVVFQGAERATGCQFTFTCDGSLARAPVRSVWMRARTVAEQALAGHVFVDAGLSTHYHADYVVPYWSAMMVKTAVIGQHAFYRMPDGYGRPAAFAYRYQQSEPQVSFGMAAVLAGEGDAAASIAEVGADARPVLDRSGAVVGEDTSLGDASRAGIGQDAKGAIRAVSARKGEGRWIIGMDGNRKPLAPNIGYESIN